MEGLVVQGERAARLVKDEASQAVGEGADRPLRASEATDLGGEARGQLCHTADGGHEAGQDYPEGEVRVRRPQGEEDGDRRVKGRGG